MSKTPILLVSLVALAGAGYLLWGGCGGLEPTPDAHTGRTDTEDGNGGVDPGDAIEARVVKEMATPKAPEEMREQPLPGPLGPGPGSLKMPDGTYMPVLNGAVGAPAVAWPEGIPYSPVRKKVVDKEGLEWYLHEDGSYTITQNLYRSDLGRTEPATTVYNPKTPLPMEPGEAKKATEEIQRRKTGAGGPSKQ